MKVITICNLSKLFAMSIGDDCPHIIWVFKLIFHNMHSRFRSLTHHVRDLTIDCICLFTNNI